MILCSYYKVAIKKWVKNILLFTNFRGYLIKISRCYHIRSADLNQAYLQLELEAESRKLLVVNTPWGLYRNKCLPFGLGSSPFLFQRFMKST